MLPSEIYPAILYWTSRKQVVENNCGETSAWWTSSSPFFTMHVTQFLQYRNYRTTRGNRCLVCIVEFLWETWGSIISEFSFERAQLFRCCGSPRVRGARPGANHLDHDGHPWRLQRIACTCRQAIQPNLQEYRFPTILPQISMGHQVSTHGNPFRLRHMVNRQRSMQRAETRWHPVTGEKGPLLRCGLSSKASGPTVRHGKANELIKLMHMYDHMRTCRTSGYMAISLMGWGLVALSRQKLTASITWLHRSLVWNNRWMLYICFLLQWHNAMLNPICRSRLLLLQAGLSFILFEQCSPW